MWCVAAFCEALLHLDTGVLEAIVCLLLVVSLTLQIGFNSRNSRYLCQGWPVISASCTMLHSS
jgi:hypothetical protein